jgi:hypothetical protein
MQQHCSARHGLFAQLRHRSAAAAALAIAELSTTEAFAARANCLLCRGLLSSDPTVRVRDRDAWVQQCCSVGHMMCAQLPLDSQVWRRWQLPNLSTTEAFAASMSCLLCRGLLSCGPAVFEHDSDVWVQRRCSVGRMMCARLPLDSQVWRALAIAELSTTEAFAARANCLLCRGLLSSDTTVRVRDRDPRVQQCCSVGRTMCARLPLDSQVWWRWQLPNLSTTEAFAASMSCLLCRGLLSCGPAVFEHDGDAWVQRRCSVGRMMCARLPLDSQVWRALAIAEFKHDRGFCRVHELFALPRLAFERRYSACARS